MGLKTNNPISNVNILKPIVSNKFFEVKIDFFKLIYFLSFFYSIYFFGAYPSDSKINLLNLFLVSSPPIILGLVYSLISLKPIKLKISLHSIFFGLIIFITFLLMFKYSGNLYSDEIFYSHKAIRFPLEILDIVFSKFELTNLDYKIFIRVFNFSFFLILYFIISSRYFYKYLYINLIILIALRFLFWRYTEGIPYIHPPLSSFSSSFLLIPFGLEEFTFKFSNIFLIYLGLLLLFNFLKISIKRQILFFTFLSIMPLVANNLLVIEQSVFFPFFLFVIILLYDKIEISNLSIIIGISILFRQTGIILTVIPFILSILKWESTTTFFKNILGVFIGFPIFFKSLLIGTPTTKKYDGLNFFFELPEIQFNYTQFIILFLIAFLIYRKELKLISLLLIVSLFYIIIFMTTGQKFEGKYLFEFYGIYLIMIAFIISSIAQIRYLIPLLIGLIFISFNIKYDYYNKENSFKKILNEINKESSQTIFIKEDYYNFSKILMFNDYFEYKVYFKLDNDFKDFLKKEYGNSSTQTQLENLFSIEDLPINIVFMESSYDKLNNSAKEKISLNYSLVTNLNENDKSFGYKIFKLKEI